MVRLQKTKQASASEAVQIRSHGNMLEIAMLSEMSLCFVAENICSSTTGTFQKLSANHEDLESGVGQPIVK